MEKLKKSTRIQKFTLWIEGKIVRDIYFKIHPSVIDLTDFPANRRHCNFINIHEVINDTLQTAVSCKMQIGE